MFDLFQLIKSTFCIWGCVVLIDCCQVKLPVVAPSFGLDLLPGVQLFNGMICNKVMAQNKTLLKVNLVEVWGIKSISLTDRVSWAIVISNLQVEFFNQDFCENIGFLLFFFLFQMDAQIQFWMT